MFDLKHPGPVSVHHQLWWPKTDGTQCDVFFFVLFFPFSVCFIHLSVVGVSGRLDDAGGRDGHRAEQQQRKKQHATLDQSEQHQEPQLHPARPAALAAPRSLALRLRECSFPVAPRVLFVPFRFIYLVAPVTTEFLGFVPGRRRSQYLIHPLIQVEHTVWGWMCPRSLAVSIQEEESLCCSARNEKH